MKTCPKCYEQYEDDVSFCKKCGTALVDSLKCPNCGASIEPQDSFCGKCGQKLKEIEPEIKEEVKKEKEPHKISFDKALSYIFPTFLVITLILASLSFIGLFGTVIYQGTTGGASQSFGLDYYSKMVDELVQSSDAGYYHYNFSIAIILLLQFIALAAAEGGAVFAIVFSIVGLVKFNKDKTVYKRYKDKLFLLFPLLSFAHPLLFIIIYSSKMDAYLGGAFISSTVSKLGWGSAMVLVTSIISLLILLMYQLIKRVADRTEKHDGRLDLKHLFAHLGYYSLVLVYIILLFVSAGRTIDVSYMQSGYLIKGYGTTMGDYLPTLLALEKASITEAPQGFGLLLLSFIFLLIAYLFSYLVILNLYKKSNAGLIVFAAITLILMILGFSFGYSGEKAFVIDTVDTAAGQMVHYSGSAIALYIFTILLPIGAGVRNKLVASK